MKSIIFILLSSALLTGCGAADRAIASTVGYSKICVDGVQYLQFTSGATVAYATDGKIKTCN